MIYVLVLAAPRAAQPQVTDVHPAGSKLSVEVPVGPANAQGPDHPAPVRAVVPHRVEKVGP